MSGTASEHYLSEVASEYLAYLTIDKGRSINTITSYAADLTSLEAYLADIGSDLLVVTTSELQRYVSDAKAHSAPASIQRAISSFRGFFSYLQAEGIRSDSPMSDHIGVVVPGRLPKALRVDQMLDLLESISTSDPLGLRDRAILEVLYGTGMRVSELCTLDLSAYRSDTDLLLVRGKGSKQRFVPLGNYAKGALEAYLRLGRAALVNAANSEEALFVSTQGHRLTRQGVWYIIKVRGSAIGMGAILSPHVFRHSCATHMIQGGADLRVVQELLGHADLSTTQIYTKITMDHLLETFRMAHPRDRGGFGASRR